MVYNGSTQKNGGIVMSVEIGMKGRAETVVTPDNTAQAAGSGLLPVFATPWMVALMENAAVNAVRGALPAGEDTVGVLVDVKHSAATPIGMRVWAEAEVIDVEDRQVVFSVTAFDEVGQIGRGTHERFIIQTDKFLTRTQEKWKQ